LDNPIRWIDQCFSVRKGFKNRR